MVSETTLTRYPHDRLIRLADAMTAVLERRPWAQDVRAVVLLDDADGGCIRPYNYPQPTDGGKSLVFVDTVAHLVEMGKALGLRVDILIDGEKVPLKDGQ